MDVVRAKGKGKGKKRRKSKKPEGETEVELMESVFAAEVSLSDWAGFWADIISCLCLSGFDMPRTRRCPEASV